MSKRTKGNRQQLRPKRQPVADVEFHAGDLPTPLDLDAPPQMRRLYEAFLGDAEGEFDEQVAQLANLVESMDPLQLLAQISLRHGFYPAGLDPEVSLADPLTQWPHEWLQGFCLRFDLADYQLGAAFNPAVVQEIVARLMQIGATSVAERFRRRNVRFGREPSDQVDGSWEQEQARGARLAERNWSYRPHMVAIVRSLSERLDGWSDVALGYRLSAVPVLLFNVEEAIEHRNNRQRRVAQAVVRHSGSAIGMCRRWQQADLPGAEIAIELERDLREGRLTHTALAMAFNRTMAQEAPAHFTFSILELEALSGGHLTEAALEHLMPLLSYRFGDLRDVDVEHLTLGNPVWMRPFIAFEDGTYFCPVPGMGLSHLLDLVGNLVPEEGKERWRRARARYLEERTQEIVAAAFPSATIYINSKYDDPPVGVDLENDLAAILGDAVLVLESKSHQVPPEVWRGAPGGMRGSIEKVVLEPSMQSANFANYMLRIRGPRHFRSEATGDFVIDSADIRSVVRANVILDPFPVARTMNPNMREARLLRDDDPDPMPTFLLSTLEAVLTLLPDELQRMHYLARRQVLQNHCLIHADEQDLLALYVETGFNLPELEDPTILTVFRGLARKEVDPYLEQWCAGRVRLPRPMRRLQPGWRRILTQLQVERPSDWVTMGMVLLDASAIEQQEMLERTNRVVRTVVAAAEPKPIEWWPKDVGLTYWRSTIVGIAVSGIRPEDRVGVAASVIDRHGLNSASSMGIYTEKP